MGGRLYNEKQVREILRKASSSQSPSADGISLEELKQVGAELGFDSQQIELAAQEVGNDSLSSSGLLTSRLHLDQTVEGEIGPEAWLGMVAAVQRYYKKAGTVTQRGSNYDWVSSEEGSSLALTVTSKNGKSRIRLESNSWTGTFLTGVLGSVFTLVFSLIAAKHGHFELAALLCLAGAALMFVLARAIRSSHQQSITRLMDTLIEEAQSADSGQTVESRLALTTESLPETPRSIASQAVTNS